MVRPRDLHMYLTRQGKIELSNNVPFISDLGTRSGLQLNGEPITVHPLRPGHVISMAESKLTFQGSPLQLGRFLSFS